ncbi:MAG: carbohydrate kinase family protein [Candidatus Portnoybacteria bacterium]|nr:carbohydrate kinase family protein [Candidatus Portnoybacteria bacterium]
MYDIIAFGSATQDVFMSSHELKVVEDEKFITKKGLCVPLGSKMFMENIFFAMGGCGTNTAVTFARQGLKAAYLGLIGQDCSGQIIKDELNNQGVSLELLKETNKWPTAYSVILSLPEIGRSILKKTGACHYMAEGDIPFDKVKTKWVYLGSLSRESYKIVEPMVNFAKENNIKVAANPVGDTQLTVGLENLRSLLNKMDILVVNQEEAARLTDLDFKKEKEIFQKLDKLVEGIVVMTKGPKGVTVSDGKDLYSAGIPKSGLVDRTGAGDAFGSGFMTGYIAKQDIAHAIQLGTANATACLQKLGATKGLLKKDDWGEWEKVRVVKELKI